MFSSIYTSMSGLVAYSRGLDVISNNVSNLNTAGFKLSTLTFEDLFYQQQFESGLGVDGQKSEFGAGVDTPGTRLSFAPGELRETASETDVAIDGNGFFVLLGEGFDGRDTYTRAGSFEFDDDGRLVDQNGRAVAALGGGGGLEEFRIGDQRVSPPSPTTRIELTDNLSLGSSQARIEGIEIVDSLAEVQEIDLLITNNGATTTGSWLVEVQDADGNPLASAGEVRFDPAGSPASGFNTVDFVFTPPNGAAPQTITIDFGEPGSFTQVTSFSGGTTSTVRFLSQDGRGNGSLVSTVFDEDGVLQLGYSNGATEAGPQLALAWFDDLQALTQLGEGRFQAGDAQEVRVGEANEDVFGRIAGSTIEISNVELTDQFTELIIIQRGFQASSQVVTTANEMLEQLIEGTRSRR